MNNVKHVDNKEKTSEEIIEYTTLKKTYTLLSNDNIEIEGNSANMDKDCNEKVDEMKRVPEDIVKAKVFETKVIENNNIVVKRSNFKIPINITN